MNWDSELPMISSLVYTSTVIKNELKKYFKLLNRQITHMLLVATIQLSIISTFLILLSEIHVHS